MVAPQYNESPVAAPPYHIVPSPVVLMAQSCHYQLHLHVRQPRSHLPVSQT